MDKAIIPQTRPQSAFPLRRFWMRERCAKRIAMIAQMLEHRMPGRKKIFMEQTNRDSATMPSTCDAVAKEAFLAFSCSEIGGSVSGERDGAVSEVGGCGVKSCLLSMPASPLPSCSTFIISCFPPYCNTKIYSFGSSFLKRDAGENFFSKKFSPAF